MKIIKEISEKGGSKSMTIAMKLKEESKTEGKIEDTINLFKEGVFL